MCVQTVGYATRSYCREPDVEAQIRRLAAVPRSRLASVALAVGANIREESLVHLLRLCRREGNHDVAQDLTRGLVHRISPKVARTVAVWRLSEPESLADDVIDEILVDFYDQIFADDEATVFWEIRFWVCVERRLLNIVRRRRQEMDREVDEFENEAGDSSDEIAALRPPESSAIGLDPETQALIADGLAQLPPLWRTAFMLKHWCGYQEESQSGGPDETIATIMGISGRSVRNYLGRAERRLAQWREGVNKYGE